MNFRRKLILLIVIIGIAGVLPLTFYSGEIYYQEFKAPVPPPSNHSQIDMSIFWQTWKDLEKNYLGVIDYKKMIYGATEGMVKSLGDPYTSFFNPEESKSFLEDINGKFGGIGMEVGLKNDKITVVAPLDKTPAQKAGIKAGDIIIKVDNKPTSEMSLDELVSAVRGEPGTKVRVSITREKEGKEITKIFNITRQVINVPSTEWKIINGNIAYIKIYQFSDNLDADFSYNALRIINSPAKKIILDLRNNPGGLLNQVQDIAGYFLPRDSLITIEQGKNNEKTDYKTRGNEMFVKYPLVVLINKGSASGAEILALALHDDRKIPLVGETSFGKGSVQRPINLRDGSLLKVTVAHWLGPNKEQINNIGVKPSIEVTTTEQNYNGKKDPQLDKAIEILNKIK